MSHFPVRIYYEDTDFSGNVYHAAYLKFMERARTEFLREQGISHSVLSRDGLAFVVRHMEIDFLAAAHIDDRLVVQTEVTARGGARLELQQIVKRSETVLVSAAVTVAAVGPGGRPVRMPAALREQIAP